MVKKNTKELKLLFGDVDNLDGLVHPKYKQQFKFADKKKIIDIAQKLTDQIIKSGIKQIVASETGVSPMAFVVSKILKKRGFNIKWLYVKFPRENRFTNQVLLHYLSQREKNEKLEHKDCNDLQKLSINSGANEKWVMSLKFKSRSRIINDLCFLQSNIKTPSKLPKLKYILSSANDFQKDNFHHAFNIVFRSTKISSTINQPFLYFDEYIDSGKTLLNAINYFNRFSAKPQFKILSYLVKIENSKQYDAIFYTLYDKHSELECYRNGVYPFENRIDLIGYFYQIDEKHYEKITLENILKKLHTQKNVNPKLMSVLSEYINEYNLVNTVKKFSKIKQVQLYIDKETVARFLIYLLEKKFGKDKKIEEFFWLSFDMYGPIWSPMPDSFHLDFWSAFDRLPQAVSVDRFLPLYEKERKLILRFAVYSFLCAKRKWKRDIISLVNKKYAIRF